MTELRNPEIGKSTPREQKEQLVAEGPPGRSVAQNPGRRRLRNPGSRLRNSWLLATTGTDQARPAGTRGIVSWFPHEFESRRWQSGPNRTARCDCRAPQRKADRNEKATRPQQYRRNPAVRRERH